MTIKDTKTHQLRILSLDPDTVTILTDHKQRAQRRCTELDTTLDDDAFAFSYIPDHRRHCDLDGITHRYTKMTTDLGIDTRLHALRHYHMRCATTTPPVWPGGKGGVPSPNKSTRSWVEHDVPAGRCSSSFLGLLV
ncbi:MAG: hypothetical protein ACRDQ4_06625 [Pseudonocardiaceae bacterium]